MKKTPAQHYGEALSAKACNVRMEVAREYYQPKTGQSCHCKPGQQRDNCPDCEGTGQRIDFAAIRARNGVPANTSGLSVAQIEQFVRGR